MKDKTAAHRKLGCNGFYANQYLPTCENDYKQVSKSKKYFMGEL